MRTPVAALLIAIAAVPASAARPDPEARLAKVLAGRVPRAPVDCIPLDRTGSSVTVPHAAIVYQQGGTFYVNRFANGCDLGDDTFLVTRTPSTQLCRGDIAELRQTMSNIPRGSCVFGSFTPYVRPGR